MALRSKSLFLYDFEVTANNRSLDFISVSGGSVKYATLTLGFYSLRSLAKEIARAMNAADPYNVYSVNIDRTFSSGTENRVSIVSNGTFLTLLFGTGPRKASSVSTLIGFNATDYTGATTYQGSLSAGQSVVTEYTAYNYLGPDMVRSVFGTLSITASGQKEAIVWQVQQFIQGEFKYEPEAKIISEWTPFMTWAIQQRPFEFTPEITNPSVVYEVTLESTSADGKGLAFRFDEMLPDFPFNYKTGLLKFRRII